MRRRGTLLWLALAGIVAAIVTAGIVLAGGDEAAAPVAKGADTAEPSDGGAAPIELGGIDPVTGAQVSLADFAGTPVVLNFWASWCGPCRAELPDLLRFAEAHPEAAVVGVNFQDTPGEARRLHDELDLTFPSIADPRGEIAAELGLRGMPTTFFLDSEHRIVGVVAGATDLAGFEQGLALAVEDG